MEVASMKNSALLPIVLLSTYSLKFLKLSNAVQAAKSGAGSHLPTNTTKKMIQIAVKTASTTQLINVHHSFEAGGDGGGPSECDKQYHSDDTPVVALSTGYLIIPKHISLSTALRRMEMAERGGCFNKITISGNGLKVKAMVVDECDSMRGCDEAHDYQPPCDNNIVDASKAVWVALGGPSDDWGDLDITWSDAWFAPPEIFTVTNDVFNDS
ncbi:LIPID TRANSFER PROTEIN [Salix purpurea]|uniref:LIPID TRANSFER PROTEIN n=1 Tax=Salix purpurea TaxID=77065 RepID=A0A9Q0SJT1_SALPP|nr:LIPID TRANSFER PROTEIN [Salix purpurea]